MTVVFLCRSRIELLKDNSHFFFFLFFLLFVFFFDTGNIGSIGSHCRLILTHEGSGFDSRAGTFLCGVVLPVSAWALSGFSSSLPQSKNMRVS